jgi:branched-subunit amino acid transport protein AzlD
MLIQILVIAVITLLTRAVSFIIFEKRKLPSSIEYLGYVLPPAIMGMLVVYALKDTHFSQFPFGIPEMTSVLVVLILHHFKRNNLLSILSGTIVYMFLVQFIFV